MRSTGYCFSLSKYPNCSYFVNPHIDSGSRMHAIRIDCSCFVETMKSPGLIVFATDLLLTDTNG
jgi:hypothetical protein